jgi:hypothetical protein
VRRVAFRPWFESPAPRDGTQVRSALTLKGKFVVIDLHEVAALVRSYHATKRPVMRDVYCAVLRPPIRHASRRKPPTTGKRIRQLRSRRQSNEHKRDWKEGDNNERWRFRCGRSENPRRD